MRDLELKVRPASPEIFRELNLYTAVFMPVSLSAVISGRSGSFSGVTLPVYMNLYMNL